MGFRRLTGNFHEAVFRMLIDFWRQSNTLKAGFFGKK